MAALTILTYGYELPNDTAFGTQHFPAMERNIQRMNDHSHNGVDGARIAAETQEVDSDEWGADLGGGSWRQEITMPDGMTFDAARIEVRTSDGEVVYPTIVKTAASKFYLYTNNNETDYVISYV